MAVAFLLYVIAEIAAIWAVGSAVGVLGTVALLIAGAFIGSWLARREGAKAMRAFVESARLGRPSEKELTDGMLVGLGGVLILVPGFVSDVLGLLLILPPSRAVARRLWLKRMEKRAVRFANQRRGPVMVVDSEVVPPQEPRRDRDQPTVIEGRVIEG
ncbi:FxsA family protein [Amycolatopsis sp. FBCC-B4732]|uniref:FxsA family protein n=1 Tax=Amycolatopsis sp. FBCC-B4732 TaxID=3079339 RepID=UPI001FF2BF6B|nr:FxsA family protein [Amycolatopsis sp. FBCC-B4732]UOX87359.1 FxsA family protein [Amycolatopsis sp. FBCC-B4732]